MDATQLLTKQHRTVEQLFTTLKDTSAASRKEVLTNLARNLVAHMKIEEEIFYPAAQDIDPDQVKESYAEHADALPLLDKLMGENLSDDQFMMIVEQFEEKISHHVKDEEGKLFPQCRSNMDPEQLSELGEEMQSLFEDIFSGAVSLEEIDTDIASAEEEAEHPRSEKQDEKKRSARGKKTA